MLTENFALDSNQAGRPPVASMTHWRVGFGGSKDCSCSTIPPLVTAKGQPKNRVTGYCDIAYPSDTRGYYTLVC